MPTQAPWTRQAGQTLGKRTEPCRDTATSAQSAMRFLYFELALLRLLLLPVGYYSCEVDKFKGGKLEFEPSQTLGI